MIFLCSSLYNPVVIYEHLTNTKSKYTCDKKESDKKIV